MKYQSGIIFNTKKIVISRIVLPSNVAAESVAIIKIVIAAIIAASSNLTEIRDLSKLQTILTAGEDITIFLSLQESFEEKNFGQAQRTY